MSERDDWIDTRLAAYKAIQPKIAELWERLMREYVAADWLHADEEQLEDSHLQKGLTADEAADRVDEDIGTVRPRITELHKYYGVLYDTGRRRSSKKGHPQKVLRPVDLDELVEAGPLRLTPKATLERLLDDLDLWVLPLLDDESKVFRNLIVAITKATNRSPESDRAQERREERRRQLYGEDVDDT